MPYSSKTLLRDIFKLILIFIPFSTEWNINKSQKYFEQNG